MKKLGGLAFALVLMVACSEKNRADQLGCTPGPLSQLASCSSAPSQYYCISDPACPSAAEFCNGSYLLYSGSGCSQSDCTQPLQTASGIRFCATNKEPSNTQQYILKTMSDVSSLDGF